MRMADCPSRVLKDDLVLVLQHTVHVRGREFRRVIGIRPGAHPFHNVRALLQPQAYMLDAKLGRTRFGDLPRQN